MHLIAAHCSLQLVIMLQIFPMIEVGEKTTKHWLEVVGKPTFPLALCSFYQRVTARNQRKNVAKVST